VPCLVVNLSRDPSTLVRLGRVARSEVLCGIKSALLSFERQDDWVYFNKVILLSTRVEVFNGGGSWLETSSHLLESFLEILV